MQEVFGFCGMVPFMEPYSVSKSSFQTVLYSTSCPLYGRITPVRHARVRKDPHHLRPTAGYDLKQLFIGGEGTLGVITGVSILTPPAPQASNNIFLALPRFKNVLPLFQTVKRQLGEILSAFEYIDRTAYDMALDHGLGPILNPDEVGDAQCFVLAETSGGNQEHDLEVIIFNCISRPPAELDGHG